MATILRSTKDLRKILQKIGPTSIVLVTSKRIALRMSETIKDIRRAAGSTEVDLVYISDGESAKEWKQLEMLLKELVKKGLDKKGLLIALGGGSVGDLVGFATSIYQRGMLYIQIPTTLLSQVDSAHGGKTGINLGGYKNQLGSVYEPVAIVIDPKMLATLSKDQVIDGLGEIIKAGFIKDKTLLSLLKKETVSSLLKSKNLETIINKAIKVKYSFTKNDLHDKGQRQSLNVGHTIGHAIELKYHLSHGKAVIIGMLKELSITENIGLTSSGVRAELQKLLDSMGIVVAGTFKPDWKAMKMDKKVSGDIVVLPIIEKIGKTKLIKIKITDLKKLSDC